MKDKIYVTQPSMPSFEEYAQEISSLWDSKWITNDGDKVNELKKQLMNYLSAQDMTLFVNGHSALESAIAAFNFPRGSEIITTPYTFISTIHAIVRNGMVPVFCDIKPEDCTIDSSLIEALITDKTVAILPVHVYGNVCDVNRIANIADKYNLKVIYDAAHAFGVKINGKPVANYGDVTMLSFHATKVFNTIEGGALCYNDSVIKSAVENIKNYGIQDEETITNVGANYKMNEFQAAMGLCNLRHLDEDINICGMIIEEYRNRLEGVSGITILQPQDYVKSNNAYFPVFFANKAIRDYVYNALRSHEIYARKYFYPIANVCDCYKDEEFAKPDTTPVAIDMSNRVLCLPLYRELSKDDVDAICRVIVEEGLCQAVN